MTETPSPFMGDMQAIIPNIWSAGELLTEIQKTVTDIVAIRVIDPAYTLPNPVLTAREIAPQITSSTAEMSMRDLAIFDMVEEVYMFVLEAVRESVRVNLELDAAKANPEGGESQ